MKFDENEMIEISKYKKYVENELIYDFMYKLLELTEWVNNENNYMDIKEGNELEYVIENPLLFDVRIKNTQ